MPRPAASYTVVVTWNAVTESLAGTPVDIAAYRVLVGRNLELASGDGFGERQRGAFGKRNVFFHQGTPGSDTMG